jgi:threonyl-tRNA synthetase
MERFVAVLIEHTGGKFPLWLIPDQVVVLPVGEKYNEYAHRLSQALDEKGIRCIVDDRNETVGKRIRENELKRIPYLLVVGEKEEQTGSVAVRRQGKGDQGVLTVEEFVNRINGEVNLELQNV